MPVPSGFMLLHEVLAVIRDLRKRAPRRKNKRLLLTIFRLSCCCGLRRIEIHGLQFRDLVLEGPRPHIIIRADSTKTSRQGKRRQRYVPLFWDKGTLQDLRDWVVWRNRKKQLSPEDYVICQTTPQHWGKPISIHNLSKRWKTAVKCLGPERVRQLATHSGRRTFATLSLEAGRSLVEVRDALGHVSITTTSIYLYAISRNVPDVFATSQQ